MEGSYVLTPRKVLRLAYHDRSAGMPMSAPDPRIGVVVVTRDRCPDLMGALEHLSALPEQPRIVVVDNASSDGTVDAVEGRYPGVEVMPLDKNLGAAGRNVGVGAMRTPYVAFSDDDSWWARGALSRAVDLFDMHPRLGLLIARILVGSEEREDPICREMAGSPLPPERDLPGPPVLGFLACAAIVRRSAYLEVGGFEPRLLIGGEEELLAADLASAGWGLAYVGEVVAHHHPSTARDARAVRRLGVRNTLWFAWLRRPASTAVHHTLQALGAASRDADARVGLLRALVGVPWVLRRRRVVPPRVESGLRMLDRLRGLNKPRSEPS
jgi:GT2 family glycosyltransferase